jgi:hypothetical protein
MNRLTAQKAGRHFLTILLTTWIVIMGSLTIGAVFGDVTKVTAPTLGTFTLITGLAHGMIFYLAFNLTSHLKVQIRVNPVISLVEWGFRGRIGLNILWIEIVAQAIGATLAGASIFALVHNNTTFLAGLGSPVINSSVGIGWAIYIEAFAMLVFSWVYFYQGRGATLAYALGATVILVYPFLGPSTHNPFRWLAACIPEGACSVAGMAVFFAAPIIGAVLGFVFYRFTVRGEQNDSAKLGR